MAMTEAKKRSNKKWNDANMKVRYDRITILVPKGRKKAIEAYAKEHGEMVSGFIAGLVRAELGLTEDEWKKPVEDDRQEG